MDGAEPVPKAGSLDVSEPAVVDIGVFVVVDVDGDIGPEVDRVGARGKGAVVFTRIR